MAENLLSDSDVWGPPSAPPGLLSDDDVWGTPKPKEQRGAVAEIGRQIVGGLVTRAPAMIGGALEWWAPQGSDLEEAGRVAKEYWTEKEKAWEPDLEGRGFVSSTLIKGASQLGPSLAGMGAAMINPVLGGAAVATIFGGQQAQDTYDKGLKAGLSETEASEAAYKTGLIEGFGETVADVAGAKLLTGGGKLLSGLIGKGGMSGAIRAATDPRMAARFARDWAANAVIQSGTEFGQGYGQAVVERDAGISTGDPLEQGAEGAQSALGMSVLLGPLAAIGGRSAAKQRAMIGDALNDPAAPLPIRMAAGEYVAKDIEPAVGKEAAQSWLQSFHEAAVQDRDAQQQPAAAAPDVATQPKPTGLLGYQPGPPLVVFPDGSTMTGAEAEQRRLDSMVQRATPSDILAAPDVDTAVAAFVDSVSASEDEFADLLKSEQSDLAYLRRDATAEAAKAADFARAKEQQTDIQIDQANALTRVSGFDDQTPTAMELALQRARQKNAAAPVQTPESATPIEAQPEPAAAAPVTAAQPALAAVGQLDETAAAAAPNVDAYLKQNAAGKWQLSRPVELAVKDAVIAEMDRRNQEGSTNAATPAQAVTQPAQQPEVPAAAAIAQGEQNASQPNAALGIPESTSLPPVETADGAAGGQEVQGQAPAAQVAQQSTEEASRLDPVAPNIAPQAPNISGVAPASEERAYPKGQAQILAKRMTNQGLPSEAYPHPTQAGMWAIRVPGEQKAAPVEVAPPLPEAEAKPTTASDWSDEMQRLRAIKPRPLDKLYGKTGPTPEQAEAHAKAMREWNRDYRKASAEQKTTLERENAEFRAKREQQSPAAEPTTAPEPKTLAEASLGDLLRAAADKADGKVAPPQGKGNAASLPSEAAKEREGGTSDTAKDEIDQRIADAEASGVVLSDNDKENIRAAFERADELSTKASRIMGRGADPYNKGNAFPLGVGFTKETKRSNQRLDASVRRAGEAVQVFNKAEMARKYADSLLAGNGTEADKALKIAKQERSQRELVKRLVNWEKGDKIGKFTIERVSNDSAGYPSSYTISGEGIVKGVYDKVDVAREFFDGSKDALRRMVDDVRADATPSTNLLPINDEISTPVISDFGERIEGARKDYAAKLKAAEAVDIASVPLSQSWPEPDYQKMIDGGADPWAVAFMRAARDEVPTKPQSSWKLGRWVKQVSQLRDFAMRVVDGSMGADRVREAMGADSAMKGILDRIDLYTEVGHAKSLKGIRVSAGDYGVFNGVEYKPPKRIWSVEQKAAKTAFSNWPKMIATGDTREEAIANFRAKWLETTTDQDTKKAIDFSIYRKLAVNEFFVGKKIGKDVVPFKEGFKTAAEARAWKADNQAELVKMLERFKDIPSERRENNSPRVGIDHRNGADVTMQQFADTFGFRGGQFGASMPQAERQSNLNETYDALMDMAGILGIPPKALSLNGELGLAFGARGKGGKGAFAAHYEPDTTGAVTADRVVINLTRARGAGSLAHEWFHAVDNYFARKGGRAGAYQTEAQRGEGVRPEMLDAFRRVMQAINSTSLKMRGRKLDQTRSKAYWSTGLEMAARSFESYIVAKLNDQNASNDYLANIVSEDYWNAAAALGIEKEGTYPYPTADEAPSIRAAFEHFFQTVETKETDKGVALESRASATLANETPATIRAGLYRSLGKATVDRLEQSGLLRILDTADSLPDGLTISSTGTALYDGKTAYLIADRTKPGEAIRAVLHEIGEHHGLEGMLGEKGYKTLTNRVRIMEKGNTRVKEAFAFVRSAYPELREDSPVFMKEVLANIGQDADVRAKPWWKEMIATVRRWLVQIGYGGLIRTSDIEDMVALSLRVAAREDQFAGAGNMIEAMASKVGAGDTAFKAVDTESAEFKAWSGGAPIITNFDEHEFKTGDAVVVKAYHGTTKEFTGFAESADMGYHFGSPEQTDEFTSSRYGVKDNAVVIPAYLSMRNPLVLDFDPTRWPDDHEVLTRNFSFTYQLDRIAGEIGKNDATGKQLESAYKAASKLDALAQKYAGNIEKYDWRDLRDEKAVGVMWKAVQRYIEASKFDGLIYENEVEGGGESFSVFRPEQIKSATSNTGAFSPTNPSILESRSKIIDDNNRTRTPEQLAMFKRVGRTVEIPTVAERVKAFRQDFWKKAAQGLVDQFAPIKELSKEAYGLMRLSKGATGAFEVFMQGGRLKLTDGAYDFDDTKRGGVIDRLLTPLQNESGDFMWWVAANRAGTLREEHVRAQARADQMQAAADVLTAKARDLDKQAKDQLQQAGNFPKAMLGNQNAQKQNAKDANQLFVEAKGLRADAAEMRSEAAELRSLNRERLFSDDDVSAGKSLASGQTDFDFTLAHAHPGHAAGTVTRDRALIYRDSLKTFNEFHKNALDMAEQSGLIDPDSRAIWEKDFYIPFYRVNDEEGFRGMSVKSGAVRQEAFKQLKGGTDKLNSDLLENTLMNWAHLIDAAAKNRAAGATIKAAVNLGIAQEVPAGTKGAVWVQEGGKKKHYTIDDPYVLTALTSLEYAGLRGGVMDALSATKHWLTIGVTASPFFKVRNLIRDSIQVIGTSDINYNPAKNLSEGFKATKRGTDEYFHMLAGGGLIRFGTMLEGNEANRTRALVEKGVDPSTILDNESKVRAFYKRTLEPMIEAYNELGNRGEEINRAALYKQLRAQGFTHAEASLEARDLMDFSMQGSWASVRFLTQVVPFMNARAQGLYKLGRASKKDPARMAAVIGAATLISLGLLAAYGDDDDWKKREDWDRNNYWWFRAGGIAYRIPKPFEVGAVATLAERTAEWMFDDEMNGKRFAQQFRHVLGDQLAMNPTPQAFKPLIDLYANKDSFSGRPIETMGMERLAPEYRFRQGTSMVARGVSTAGNTVAKAAGLEFLSPVQVDHLVRGYFSWLGTFIVGGADMAVRSMSNEPTRPALDYWKTATGGMIAETSSASSRYVSQLYDQAKELEEAHGTWRALLKEGKTAEAKEYQAENRDKLARYRSVEAVKRKETQLNNQIRLIERSSADPDTKRERINKLRARQSDIAKALSMRTAQ